MDTTKQTYAERVESLEHYVPVQGDVYDKGYLSGFRNARHAAAAIVAEADAEVAQLRLRIAELEEMLVTADKLMMRWHGRAISERQKRLRQDQLQVSQNSTWIDYSID